MAISTTNIRLSDIQTEFGGSNPIGLSEYYRGGVYVPTAPTVDGGSNGTGVTFGSTGHTRSVPTSGQITFGNFKNTGKILAVTATVTANQVNFNLLSTIYSFFGSFTAPISCTLTINAGVYVYSNTTSTAGLSTGSGWPLTSTINIINNGYIIGMGGAGGGGAGPNATYEPPENGYAGGPAISILNNVTIDNTNGYIYGGGGGGGGGADLDFSYPPYTLTAAGGGGGGGRSYSSSAGGLRGLYVIQTPGGPSHTPGVDGGSGSLSGAGAGGAGGQQQWNAGNLENPNIQTRTGAAGGNGGDWGAAGSSGSSTATQAGASGGAAGKAINLNGYTATFSGGNNGTQVKGAVS